MPVIATVYVHFQYAHINSDTSVEIDYHAKTLTISEGAVTEKLTQADIEEVTLVQSIATYRKSLRFMCYDDYFYLIIKSKSGNTYVLTTLIDTELKEVMSLIQSTQVHRISKIIAWPSSTLIAVSK